MFEEGKLSEVDQIHILARSLQIAVFYFEFCESSQVVDLLAISNDVNARQVQQIGHVVVRQVDALC